MLRIPTSSTDLFLPPRRAIAAVRRTDRAGGIFSDSGDTAMIEAGVAGPTAPVI